MLIYNLHRDVHTWSSCWAFSGVGLEQRSHTLLHYIKTWLRSHACGSDKRIRIAKQESTVEQEDPVWKFFQANANFIRIIWCRNAVPTLCFSTTPLGFFQLHVHSVIPCLR